MKTSVLNIAMLMVSSMCVAMDYNEIIIRTPNSNKIKNGLRGAVGLNNVALNVFAKEFEKKSMSPVGLLEAVKVHFYYNNTGTVSDIVMNERRLQIVQVLFMGCADSPKIITQLQQDGLL
jgi:hypothetical protein